MRSCARSRRFRPRIARAPNRAPFLVRALVNCSRYSWMRLRIIEDGALSCLHTLLSGLAAMDHRRALVPERARSLGGHLPGRAGAPQRVGARSQQHAHARYRATFSREKEGRARRAKRLVGVSAAAGEQAADHRRTPAPRRHMEGW